MEKEKYKQKKNKKKKIRRKIKRNWWKKLIEFFQSYTGLKG